VAEGLANHGRPFANSTLDAFRTLLARLWFQSLRR
jgi:hypothetical protein